METQASQCAATRKDGSRCRGTPRPGRVHCFAHDPELQEKARAARVQGGRNKAVSVRAQKSRQPTLEVAATAARIAIIQVLDGRMQPARGTAIASLTSALLRVHETEGLEVRLADLEARLERQATKQGRKPA